jgi:hypothetical protein
VTAQLPRELALASSVHSLRSNRIGELKRQATGITNSRTDGAALNFLKLRTRRALTPAPLRLLNATNPIPEPRHGVSAENEADVMTQESREGILRTRDPRDGSRPTGSGLARFVVMMDDAELTRFSCCRLDGSDGFQKPGVQRHLLLLVLLC